ncbi:APC membrane recruitment protein 2 [Hippopotamus amphibius kiboko]|uniref:APC membrane recruitment protein 2 n=1 Tax=Hippopotamus amphibius kiboko TaxID=575201 RepID=UPI002595529D|nr:APC membrane recruitment protein 2 [Hippopotamus amphibius kiboko]
METGGRGAAVSGGRAAAGGCGRKARAAAGTLAADMDLHCDRAAEPPAAEPPSGKINRAAFKLFKKRKPGGAMPSIFGVKNKGDAKGAGPAGLVRSRTHDGLAEALALEGGRREEPRAGGGGGGDGARPGPAAPRAAPGGAGPAAGGSVAKSHSFFSLLRKNGRPESGGAEQADAGKAGGRQKRGLRGLLGGVRWRRKDRRPKDAAPAGRAGAPGGLARPGSLTASLECVTEEAPAAARPPEPAGEPAAGEPEPACAPGEGAAGPGRAERPRAAPGPEPEPEPEPEPRAGEGRPAEDAAGPGAAPAETAPRAASDGGRAPAARDPASVDAPCDPSADRICLMFSDVTSLKSFDSLTGCGDIIADPEDEAGPGCAKHAPAPGQPGPAEKPPGVVAYQGGGEEMASPAEADDSYLQEFWDMLSQAEDQGQGPQEGAAPAAAGAQGAPEAPRDARAAEAAKDASSVKRRRLHRVPAELQPKEEPEHPDAEPQEGVPNGDEGRWDSPAPGPEHDGSGGGARKAGLPRDSDGGDALCELCAEPDGSPAALPAAGEETSCASRLKPVSPVTITCPLRTPGSLLKDSKIPISVKHLANLPSSHPVVHQQPARSELPRTKIPVSKVLVRRVSSRGLAGTTLRAAACHDSAKKL